MEWGERPSVLQVAPDAEGGRFSLLFEALSCPQGRKSLQAPARGGAETFPGSTGALSRSLRGWPMSIIPGREDRGRDTVSVYLASPLARNPSQFRTCLS